MHRSLAGATEALMPWWLLRAPTSVHLTTAWATGWHPVC